MPGYKHPCKYCGALLEENVEVCPICEKVNPLGPLRCPICKNPIHKDWKKCSNCGLELKVICPKCGEVSFLGDYCDHCGARLTVICSRKSCKYEQPPISVNCIKCGKPLK